MEKISLVNVSPETRKTIKEQVIRLHKKGMRGKVIAETLNLSEFAVSRIVSAFKKKGMKCVNEKTIVVQLSRQKSNIFLMNRYGGQVTRNMGRIVERSPDPHIC